MKPRPETEAYAKTAAGLFPGGVNSPVRAFKNVGCVPIVAKSAKGSKVVDEDGNSYIDFMGSWGPMILGHSDDDVVEAIQKQVAMGCSYGLSSMVEGELATLIQQTFPSMQKLRFVNSGTEATMSALRLARGYTQRNKIIKFIGCYHGHADHLLVQAGSGVSTHSKTTSDQAPSSAGVPQAFVNDTLLADFNDIDAVEALFSKHVNEIAAIIVEPVAGNMGVVVPNDQFLQKLRQLCDTHNSLLIFDEVMTGFRVARGGAQALYDVRADITCLGKIIGGGMPVGAYGGRDEIMQRLSPLGDVYQAGTLSGNPVCMVAGIATLKKLYAWKDVATGADAYAYLEKLGQILESELQPTLQRFANKVCLQRLGSMFTLFFTGAPIQKFADVAAADHSLEGPFVRFYQAMLNEGYLLPPSGYEAAFFGVSHTKEEIQAFARCAAKQIDKVLT